MTRTENKKYLIKRRYRMINVRYYYLAADYSMFCIMSYDYHILYLNVLNVFCGVFQRETNVHRVLPYFKQNRTSFAISRL